MRLFNRLGTLLWGVCLLALGIAHFIRYVHIPGGDNLLAVLAIITGILLILERR